MVLNKTIITYAILLVLTGIFLWVVNFFNISYPLSITSKSASGELSVVGEGKVDITPDIASVDLGIIVNDAKSVEEAQNKINIVNNAIIAGMKSVGIDPKDISFFSEKSS